MIIVFQTNSVIIIILIDIVFHVLFLIDTEEHSQQSQTQVFLVLPNILYLLNQHKQLTDGRDFCCDMVC